MNVDTSVWMVTYYDRRKEPIVTVFNNGKAAYDCYKYFLGKYDIIKVSIDEVPIYKDFIIHM